ncbi:hypothetical protein ACLOAV_003413 [Pseudogymnoascus australis]
MQSSGISDGHVIQGKRKKAAKAPTKKKNEPLATTFPCLFCNHEKSVSAKIDKKAGVGHLSCKVCDQSFSCSINYLSLPVDVYSEWVDACDTVAQENKEAAANRPRNHAIPGRAGEPERGLEDDLDDEGVDRHNGYGGKELMTTRTTIERLRHVQ